MSAEADPSRGNDRHWPLVVVALALAMRAAYFLEFRETPYYDHPLIDAFGYDVEAMKIVLGGWLGHQIFYQDPLYHYFIAAVYTVFGHVPLVVYLLQILMGCALALLAMRLAGRVFAGTPHARAVAVLSGVLTALATPLVFYEMLLLKATLGTFLTVVHLLALIAVGERVARHVAAGPGGAGRVPVALMALGAGVLLGLNILGRGNYQLIAPVFALWLGWRALAAAGGRGRAIRVALATMALYTAGTLCAVLPATVRNYVVGGEWVLVTAHGGINLYIGNNEHNTTGFYDVPAGVRAHPELQMADFREIAERDVGRPLSLAEMDRYYIARAWRWVTENPGDAARVYLRKWALWLAGYEPSNNYSLEFVKRNFSVTMRLPLVTAYTFGTLGWTALLLCLLFPRRGVGALRLAGNPNLVLMVAFVLAYSVSVTLIFVLGRYRLPLYPVLIILAAALAVSLATRWRELTARVGTVAAGVALAVAVVVSRPLWQADWWWFGRVVEGTQHFNVAMIYLEGGERERGLDFLDRAVALLGTNHRDALMQAADSYVEHGLPERAIEVVTPYVDAHPSDAGAWRRLGELAQAAGRDEAARRALARARALDASAAADALRGSD